MNIHPWNLDDFKANFFYECTLHQSNKCIDDIPWINFISSYHLVNFHAIGMASNHS